MEEEPREFSFKVLLVGDSGVGKSSLLVRFTTGTFSDLPPTIGVDFKTKTVRLAGKSVKLSIWDTAGQERFRTLTSSYYRGAQGVVLVYDVTRAETLQSLQDTWLEEVQMYGTITSAIRLVVGNKIDQAGLRQVSAAQGIAFARRVGALFVETSAKGGTAVDAAFEELVLKILDTPDLLGPSGARSSIVDAPKPAQTSGCC